MRKETIDNVLVRIFGTIFGLGIALTGLLLFFVGIVFCTTVIGILIGVPMIFCSFAFVPGGIIGAFEMAIKGKAEFKFLDKFKQCRKSRKLKLKLKIYAEHTQCSSLITAISIIRE